jgi:hypothetical protein
MQDKVSKNAYLSAIQTSPIALIPIADIFMRRSIVSDYKDVFLNDLGIKPVMEFITNNKDIENSNHHIIISKNTDKWKKIKTLVDEINTNIILDALNIMFQNDKPMTEERVLSYIQKFMSAGILATIWDEFMLALGKVSGVTLKTGSGEFLLIAIGVYIIFCHSLIIKIMDELTNNAIKIYDFLHN